MKNYTLMYHFALAFNVPETLAKAGIDEWMQVWPGMIFFKGAESLSYYTAKINEQKNVRIFFVAEYDSARSTGWMPQTVWEWIKSPSEPAKDADELVTSPP